MASAWHQIYELSIIKLDKKELQEIQEEILEERIEKLEVQISKEPNEENKEQLREEKENLTIETIKKEMIEKGKSDYMPTPMDYKDVASRFMPGWKSSNNAFASIVLEVPILVEPSVTTPKPETSKPEVIDPPVATPQQEEKQQVETKPSTIPKHDTTKPVMTELPVTPILKTKQQVEIKPPVNERKPINNNYEYKANTNEGSRWHALGVNTKDATDDFKNKYKNQKDDHLKTSILDNFRKIIEETVVQSPKQLNDLKESLKATEEYKVLEKGQGVMTRVFGMETSSVKAFNEMMAEKKSQIPEQQSNTTIQNK